MGSSSHVSGSEVKHSTYEIEVNIRGHFHQQSLTSDPEKCKGEPTFIFDFGHFGLINVEIEPKSNSRKGTKTQASSWDINHYQITAAITVA